jgi:hypothetical protein
LFAGVACWGFMSEVLASLPVFLVFIALALDASSSMLTPNYGKLRAIAFCIKLFRGVGLALLFVFF